MNKGWLKGTEVQPGSIVWHWDGTTEPRLAKVCCIRTIPSLGGDQIAYKFGLRYFNGTRLMDKEYFEIKNDSIYPDDYTLAEAIRETATNILGYLPRLLCEPNCKSESQTDQPA